MWDTGTSHSTYTIAAYTNSLNPPILWNKNKCKQKIGKGRNSVLIEARSYSSPGRIYYLFMFNFIKLI